MSWQAYADNLKAAGVEVGGVFGLDGSKWAEIEGTNSSAPQIATIVKAMKAGGFTSDMVIGKHAYRVINIDNQIVTAKCKQQQEGVEENKCLVHVALANTCVVVGGMSGAGERGVIKIVEDLAEYLRKSNY